jgi:hypothetical protein
MKVADLPPSILKRVVDKFQVTECIFSLHVFSNGVDEHYDVRDLDKALKMVLSMFRDNGCVRMTLLSSFIDKRDYDWVEEDELIGHGEYPD